MPPNLQNKSDVLQGTLDLMVLRNLGKRQLEKEKQAWERMAGIIHTLLHSEA
jgi:hypothetical protein